MTTREPWESRMRVRHDGPWVQLEGDWYFEIGNLGEAEADMRSHVIAQVADHAMERCYTLGRRESDYVSAGLTGWHLTAPRADETFVTNALFAAQRGDFTPARAYLAQPCRDYPKRSMPTGECGVCGATKPVGQNGALHYHDNAIDGGRCAGSGVPPFVDRMLTAAELVNIPKPPPPPPPHRPEGDPHIAPTQGSDRRHPALEVDCRRCGEVANPALSDVAGWCSPTCRDAGRAAYRARSVDRNRRRYPHLDRDRGTRYRANPDPDRAS